MKIQGKATAWPLVQTGSRSRIPESSSQTHRWAGSWLGCDHKSLPPLPQGMGWPVGWEKVLAHRATHRPHLGNFWASSSAWSLEADPTVNTVTSRSPVSTVLSNSIFNQVVHRQTSQKSNKHWFSTQQPFQAGAWVILMCQRRDCVARVSLQLDLKVFSWVVFVLLLLLLKYVQ